MAVKKSANIKKTTHFTLVYNSFRSDPKKTENVGILNDDDSLNLEDQDRARVSRLFYLQLYSSVLNAEKREVEERLQTRAQQQKNSELAEVSSIHSKKLKFKVTFNLLIHI